MNTQEYTNIFNQETSHFFYRANHSIFLSFLKSYIKKNGLKKPTILDAGCGTGLFAKKLSSLGKVSAIDIHPKAIEYARLRGVDVKNGSVERLPYKSGSFDIVTSIDVLYHKSVKKIDKALREINRVLKPGGLVLIRVPAFSFLYSSHDRFVHTKKRFTAYELNKYLTRAGLKIIKISYMNSLLFAPAFLKSLVDRFSKQKKIHSAIDRIPTTVNALFTKLLTSELFLLKNFRVPFGIGVFALAQKKPTKTFNKLSSLTIFFPFFNDEGTVQAAIVDAHRYGGEVAKELEVIAIHGGASKDRTFEMIKKMKKKFPKLIIIDKKNNWERYAVIKYGFRRATGEWVFYTDGDLQYSLEDVKKLVKKQQQTDADVVNGYRIQRSDNFIRVIPGNIYKVLTRIIFKLPIRDLECDFRLIKNDFIKRINLTAHNASILLELIKKLELVGARFAEVRARHYHRRYGKSTYNPFILLWEKVSGDFHIWRKLK